MLRECGGIEIEIHHATPCLGYTAGMMPARSCAPHPVIGNLHTKSAVERNRRVDIAANDVYLVEDRLAHKRFFPAVWAKAM